MTKGQYLPLPHAVREVVHVQQREFHRGEVAVDLLRLLRLLLRQLHPKAAVQIFQLLRVKVHHQPHWKLVVIRDEFWEGGSGPPQ